MSDMPAGPANYVISRVIKPTHTQDFETSLKSIAQELVKQEGHMGFGVIRPTNPRKPEYTVIMRFDNYEHLKTWEESPVRSAWLATIEPFIQEPPRQQIVTGLEFWFTPPGLDIFKAPPPRYKQSFVTWATLFPLSFLLNLLFGSELAEIPLLLRVMLVSGVLTAVMSYLAMPFTTRLFARWLYKSP